ncbi:hypothetical protein CLOM_g6707 [Closterium sp. NIES-68]|nr:hypothetical protein CLOM_g6707 [Closterium sp. NIES-68]
MEEADPIVPQPPGRGGQQHAASPGLRQRRCGSTPESLLLLFCAINMVNYVDRGAIASNGINGSPSHCQGDICDAGTGIQGDFALSNFQDGLLATAFLVGLLTASPLFAHASKRHNPFRLIAVGLLVWTLAVAGCGLSPGLLSLLLCRMLVGVGEASFISLAAPFIDDNAPPGKTAQWLATFYLCIPVGFALGYLYGGVAGPLLGWRGAFLVEAVFMVPFVVYTATAQPPPLKGRTHANAAAADEERGEGAPSVAATAAPSASLEAKHEDGSLLEDSLSLARNEIFSINVLGYAAYTFVIGAYAYWAPKAMREIFHEERADTLFGGITVVTGVGGTLFGGLMLDRMGATIPNALMLQSRVTVVGAIFCLLAFLSPSIVLFVLFMALGEFFIFAIQDAVGNWRISMGIFTSVLLPAAALWAHGATLVPPSQDQAVQPILHSCNSCSPSSYNHPHTTTSDTDMACSTGTGTSINSPMLQGRKRSSNSSISVESTPLFDQ